MDLVDDKGWQFQTKYLNHEDQFADWKRWQAYKTRNRERFKAVDVGIMEEHLAIALTWRSL